MEYENTSSNQLVRPTRHSRVSPVNLATARLPYALTHQSLTVVEFAAAGLVPGKRFRGGVPGEVEQLLFVLRVVVDALNILEYSV